MRETEKKIEEANNKATQAEEKVKKMEDHIELTRTMQLKTTCVERQQEATTTQEEKVQELEKYIWVQGEYLANQMFEMIRHRSEMQTAYE